MFPAHAGMIPDYITGIIKAISVPRACGDDPSIAYASDQIFIVFPAHAGMIPSYVMP